MTLAENNRYVQNLADDETEPHEDWFKDYATRIIGFGVNTDTTDHPYYPTEGYRNDVYLEMGLKMLGGDSQFAKLRLSHSRYFELFDGGYVFAVRGLGGRTLSGTLEENEEFKIGGANTLRGYSYGANDSLKGDNMLVVNAEFRFPIVERVTGVVFTDWGRAWDNDEKITLSELNNSFGLGVRLDTPLASFALTTALVRMKRISALASSTSALARHSNGVRPRLPGCPQGGLAFFAFVWLPSRLV